jgi:Uncharacterized protein conserved in bacteria (DUF2125)
VIRRHPLITGAVVLGILIVAHVIYWFVLAHIVAKDIANWADQQRAQGFTVSFGNPEIGGFPGAVRAYMADPDITAPGGLWRWQGPEVELSVLPWAPLDLLFWAPGHHHLSLAGNAPRDLTLDADSLLLGLDLDRQGQLANFNLDLGGAKLNDSQAGEAAADRAKIEGHLPLPPPGDPDHSSLDLTIEGSGIQLPPSVHAVLGQTIKTIHLVTQLMGPVPSALPREALASWRDGGGILQLRESVIEWGPLWAKGDGTLALDQDMQPLGSGSYRIAGLAETLTTFAAAGMLDPGTAKLAQMMFGALARPPAGGGRPEVTLPLSIQNGYANMGPIKLLRLPPIDWSGLP